jgi:hypothetical protein
MTLPGLEGVSGGATARSRPKDCVESTSRVADVATNWLLTVGGIDALIGHDAVVQELHE